MSEYTLDLNGKRYRLSDEFRESIEKRARLEYEGNEQFSCWWKTDDGDPVLVIETVGVMAPWDDIDQLEMNMNPEEKRRGEIERNHFRLTPQRFDEVPDPGGHDPDRIPAEPDELDSSKMIMWVPEHPEIDVTWSAGQAMVPVDSWVEWNVQEKAEQPRPEKGKKDSHDAFESLCRTYDCEVIEEANPSNNIPQDISGQVQRKGKDWYDGDVVGDRWNV
jgi:hypothetical protein